MRVAESAAEVLAAVQEVKKGAPDFCTNFFPDQKKLTGWIEHRDLGVESHSGAVFLFRNDRGFKHLMFCARDQASLQTNLVCHPGIHGMRLVTDLVGREGTTTELESVLGSAGFRPYSRLVRLNRGGGGPPLPPQSDDPAVVTATLEDASRVEDFLRTVFDPWRDQLPPAYELADALGSGQIRVIRSGGKLAALLFSENQGFTSSVRYWGVAEDFRARRFGGALLRDYFAHNPSTRRFILWVAASNEDALQKYRHYSYAFDGLTDTILKLN